MVILKVKINYLWKITSSIQRFTFLEIKIKRIKLNFPFISKMKNKFFGYRNNLFIVTVPFFNAQKWIGRCIRSLKIQRYNKFKCVLIDDVSNDNSFKIISNLIKQRHTLFLSIF